MVEKLAPLGNVSWANVYRAGAAGSSITRISQTTDSGYIAVGNATDTAHNTGGLVLRLNTDGSVRWQKQLRTSGSTQVYFEAVEQTSDGGFVVTGELLVPSGEYLPPTSVLAVKFDSSGNIQWQRSFNNLSSSGSAEGREHALSIIRASDGGYVIGGNWNTDTYPRDCCAGALLLKLVASGSLQWQRAYTGVRQPRRQRSTIAPQLINSAPENVPAVRSLMH